MTGRVKRDGEEYLEHKGEEEFEFLGRELVGCSCAVVAKGLFATSRAGVKFRALADDDATRLALVGAIALQAPHHRHRGRVLRARRVRKAFYLRREMR
jgi:hypothetical protein